MKEQRVLISFSFIVALLCFQANLKAQPGHITIYPSPLGEPLSNEYQVSIAGQKVPVYEAKIAPADSEKRWKAMDDKKNSASYFDTGAFAYFDIQGSTTVTISISKRINNVRVLPASAEIKPAIHGNSIMFTVDSPMNLTIEINGEWIRSLHLFINPPEKDAHLKDDPDIIYFGPGIHEISHLVV